MKNKITRRDFVRTSAVASVAAGMVNEAALPAFAQQGGSRRSSCRAPTACAPPRSDGDDPRRKDTLDAVVAGVNIVEDDPKDQSVGYGGLPNEEGVVELDASVMHGPTHRAGAVASLHNIKNPSLVAKVVMERTDHLLLVAEGALRFALAHGFKPMDLLTEESRPCG